MFGLAGVLGAYVGLSALQLTFGRTLFAALALVAVTFSLLKSSTSKRPVINGLLVGSGVLLAVHWVLFFASINASTVAIGLVTFSTCTVFVALLEPWYFRERLNPLSVGAAFCVLLGIVIMSGALFGELVYVKGLVLGIFSGFTFAVLQLVNRKLANTSGSVTTALIQNAVAALVLLPFVWSGLGAIQSQQWLILVFLGIGCTALAQTLFIYSLKHIKVVTASLIAAGLEPVYGVLLAAVVLSQLPGLHVLVGGTLVPLTVVLVTYSGVSNK